MLGKLFNLLGMLACLQRMVFHLLEAILPQWQGRKREIRGEEKEKRQKQTASALIIQLVGVLHREVLSALLVDTHVLDTDGIANAANLLATLGALVLELGDVD